MAARKPKIPKSQTTTILSVRLPIEHKEAIGKAAVEAKTTTSAYAARVLVEAASGKAPAPSKAPEPDAVEAPKPIVTKGIVLSDPKALDELRRIGVNINQIAHALNAGRQTRDGTLASAARQLFVLLKDPDAFMRTVQQIPLPPVELSEGIRSAPAAAETTAPKLMSWPSTEPPLPNAKIPMPDIMAVLTPQPVRRDDVEQATKVLATGGPPVVYPAPSAPAPAEAGALKTRRHRPAPIRKPAHRPDAPSPTLVLAPPQRPAPTLTAPTARALTKEVRRDSPHPQTRHQLQDRAPLRPARPGPAEDRKPGRLGFLSKLWGR